jgi:hypothetical protein
MLREKYMGVGTEHFIRNDPSALAERAVVRDEQIVSVAILGLAVHACDPHLVGLDDVHPEAIETDGGAALDDPAMIGLIG